MSILGKLKFWKKEDDFNFDDIANKDMNKDLFKGDDLGLQQQQPFQEQSPFPQEQQQFQPPQQEPSGIQQLKQQQQSSYPQQNTGFSGRDIDLLSSKLDTIKALLNSMDQRIANLERSAGVEKKERLW
ncbi:hypothetical protein COY27_03295 [Candidatus Woesearchaeota archaeon CG_4_10_14_0_2_um_filter_33_13]|nr:MAG: hypothetical protein COY27_03295 [Candidatus Woesearchaeota archaeon CG_4_10_14_0_2_um_filter_33_13]